MSMLLMGCGGAVVPAIVTGGLTIDATGLVLTITLNTAATGTGAVTGTVDGAACTFTYSSGTGTATWVYGITNGNPSGNPVLAGAEVLLSAAAGVWSASGVPSAAVVDGEVTNNSTVLYPSQLSGVVNWVRSLGTLWQLSTLTTPVTANNDPVGAWVSADAGVHNLLQATSDKRPLFKTNIQNGKPCVLFDGVNDFLRASFTLPAPCTIYLALKQVTWFDTGYIADGAGGVDNRMVIIQRDTTPLIRTYNNGSYGPNLPTLALGTFGIIKVVFDGASSSATLNNGTPVTGTLSGATIGGLTLCGSGAGGSPNANVYIGEVIQLDNVPSAGVDAAIWNYLNQQWAAY